MARKGERDLVGTTVLAFLLQAPRHPYDLHRAIVDTHKDYITGLPRSLYHAVDRLVRDELIEPVETAREGRRPERTIYRITDEGRSELAHRVRRMLEDTDGDTTVLAAGLSLIGCLPPRDVERSLQTRAAVLEGSIASADAALSGLESTGLPRLLVVELEYVRAVRAAELDWLRGFIDDLHTGKVDWPAELNGLLEQASPKSPPDTTT